VTPLRGGEKKKEVENVEKGKMKFGAVALALLLLIGGIFAASAVAQPEEKVKKDKKDKTDGVSDASKRVHSKTPVDKNAKSTEDIIDSEIGATALTTENVEWIRTDTLSTETSYATAYGSYQLYEELVDDPDYDYYILWLKGTGINKVDVCPLGDDGNLYEVRVGINLNRGSDTITDWEPVGDTSTGSPITITASLQVTHGGVIVPGFQSRMT
jgi:hypothetical protein